VSNRLQVQQEGNGSSRAGDDNSCVAWAPPKVTGQKLRQLLTSQVKRVKRKL